MTNDRKQQQNAARITLITAALTAALAIATVFFVPNEDKTPIDNYAMPFIALSASVSYYLVRKNPNPARGIYLLLASIAVISILYPFAANNVGWQTAIGMLLITTSVAYVTLPERIAGRISGAAFLYALVIILIEIFAPGIIDIPATGSSVVVTILLSAVYLGLILYRFRQLTLRTKLVTAFIALSVMSVGTVTLAIYRSVLTQLTSRVEQQLTGVASQTSSTISSELITQVNLLRAFSVSPELASTLFKSKTTAGMAELQRRDQQWREADALGNDQDALVRSVLDHELSGQLLEFRNNFPEHVEVFFTDVNGALIASTNRTSDYYQADEEWWQGAYNEGRGAIYISQPVFDESSQTLSVQMAVPVLDPGSGAIQGVFRTTVNLNILVQAFEIRRLGETGRTEIYLPNGYELEIERESGGEYHIKMEDAPDDFVAALQQTGAFLDTTHDDELILAGQSPLLYSTDSEDVSAALERLDWTVVTIQNRAEALQIIADLSLTAQLAGLIALAAAGLMAVGMAQFLILPVVRLTQAAEEISSGNLHAQAQVEAPDEIGLLAESFNRMTGQLRETLGNLEQRVAERTADLEIARLQSENRASQLLAVGEISRIINTEQKMDILLSLITRLVSERFGIYHTGIFLVDETGQFAVLQAANSEGGRTMLKRGHKLEIGESGIVGYVTKFGIPRIALDVGLDAVYFNNPDLPNTRSEMALPLKVREVIIGALDVQSEEAGAFTEEDAGTLSILADQIAIAIENARLFAQAEQSLNELQTLYGTKLQEGWLAFSHDEEVIGYQHSLGSGKPLVEPVNTDEIQQAMNRGDALVFHADGKNREPSMVIPLKLRGQIIGVMQIKAPTRDREWTANEINLTEAVSDRLSLALENARLIEESQRQAIKEQTISEITGKIGSSINLQNVLLTAAEELGRSIPGSEVIIKFQSEATGEGSE